MSRSPKIYIIKNKINNKIYIGKTIKDLEKRFKEHILEATKFKNNPHSFKYNSRLYPAMNKYGYDKFFIELLENVDEKDNINEREKYYISKYNSIDDDIGYNISPGGLGGALFKGHKHTEKTKKLLSEKNYWKTHKQSPEYVEKRVKKHRKKFQNLSTLQVITGCKYEDKLLNETYSVWAAAANHRKIRGNYWIKIVTPITRKEADKIIDKYEKEYATRKLEMISKQKINKKEAGLLIKQKNNDKFREMINKLDLDQFEIDHTRLTLKDLSIKYNISYWNIYKIIRYIKNEINK